MRITAALLAHEEKVQQHIDRCRAKWEAEDAKRGRPPTDRERYERLMYEIMIEDTEWDRFIGASDVS